MRRLDAQLLRWLLPPLLLLVVALAPIRYLRSEREVDAAHDRALLGSAMVIAERVRVEGARVVVDLPVVAIDMLEAQVMDRVFFNVSCIEPPAYLAGWEDLPAAPQTPGDEPVFVDRRYNGVAIRLVAIRRSLPDAPVCASVLVRVGETTTSRDAQLREILADAALMQITLITSAALLVIFGVRRGLQPLRRLGEEVQARPANDLSPIDSRPVPRDVVPLVDAINALMHRQRGINESHRRFVADASHQLKTPLAVLKAQSQLALQQTDPERARAHVQELHDCTDGMSRVVRQLLALLRSDPLVMHGSEAVDLVKTARAATFELLPLALAKPVELGFEEAGAPATVNGLEVLLHELVTNLVDNAIRYTPPGGRIEVQAGTDAAGRAFVSVGDSGPGIPADQRERVFTRFYRAPGSSGDGCGLGLAIVKQIAERYGASVALGDTAAGGLLATVLFPPAPVRGV